MKAGSLSDGARPSRGAAYGMAITSRVKLKEQIRYHSQPDRGARIRITTATQRTDAVHAFLLFQIVDHQTGDAPNISDDISEE